MKTSVKSVTETDFPECLEFLARHESRCITLMSYLILDGKPDYPKEGVKAFISFGSDNPDRTAVGVVVGVLFLTRTGILLHCIDDGFDKELYRPALRHFFSGNNIRCIIGADGDTRYLESLMTLSSYRSVDYQLMILDTIPALEKETIVFTCPDGSKPEIRRGVVEEAKELLPLQEGYEREEVLPPGDPFDPERCLANLERNLDQQYIWIVSANGQSVTKAGTNARGLRWDQLGGVYTAPEWRNRGLATALVAHAARCRMMEDRKVALFVKLTNSGAIRAYTKVGFTPAIPFRISYY